MRYIPILIAIVILTGAAAASSEAQTITIYDSDGARAGLRFGYGGNGPDWDASIESPLLADIIRFRGSVGRGLWHSEFDSYPDPAVTRFAGSAIAFIPSRDDVRPYIGLGLAAYVPRGAEFTTQTGRRVIAGMEGWVDRWTIGVEVELDLPRAKDLQRTSVDTDLMFAGRIGIAMRRGF